MKIYIHTKICTQMFIVGLIIIAKLGTNQMSLNMWMDKKTIQHYSTIKRNNYWCSQHRWISKALFIVKETSLKKFHAVRLHLCDILRKAVGMEASQWLPGVRSVRRVWLQRDKMREFGGVDRIIMCLGYEGPSKNVNMY